MRVALLSPLPPAPSGVADYTTELVPELAARLSALSLVVADDASAPEVQLPPNVSVRRLSETDLGAHDATVFHHGNNPLHRFVVRAAASHPGLAVLHDPVLHHALAHEHLGDGREDWAGYRAALSAAEGPLGAAFAGVRRNGLIAPWHVFLLPAIDHVASRSLAALVHSAAGARLLAQRYPLLPVTRVPHPFTRPPAGLDSLTREQARDRLGLPRDAFIVASFGFVTPSKRIEQALTAFSAVRRELGNALYLVVGKVLELDRANVDALGLGDRARFTGHVPMDVFLTYLQAVDVVVNLRYPFAGEASGTLMRALGAGRPCIVSRTPMAADHPEDVTLTVPTGDDEGEALAAALRRLHADPAAAAELGQRARTYARERCSLAETARRHVEAIASTQKLAAGLATFREGLLGGAAATDLEQWGDLETSASLHDCVRRLRALDARRVLLSGPAQGLAALLRKVTAIQYDERELPGARYDAAVAVVRHPSLAPLREHLARQAVAEPHRLITLQVGTAARAVTAQAPRASTSAI